MEKILKFKTKHIRNSTNQNAHTKVFYNDVYLGLFIKNELPYKFSRGTKWQFCSEDETIHYFNTKTKNQIYEILTKQILKEEVTLQLYFGETITLNKAI